MLVNSSGSMNPAASPSATQLCDQKVSASAAGEADGPGIGERRSIEVGEQQIAVASSSDIIAEQ